MGQPILAHLRALRAAPGKMPQRTELGPWKRSAGLVWAQFEDIYSNRPSYSPVRQVLFKVVRAGTPHTVRPCGSPTGARGENGCLGGF